MLNKFWTKTSLTVRITLVLLALIAGSMTLFVGARSAMAANLKSVSIISKDTLTLGDIFDGLKHNADYVLGPSPQPGQEITLNARTLYRIAVALDLPWRPKNSGEQVVIRREATIVPYSVIESSLRKQLETKGVNGKFNIALNNGKPTITLPNNMPEHVEVTYLDFDTQKDFFKATVVSPSRDNPLEKMTVSGMVERLVSVPVLRSNLQNGDVIGKNDIEIIDVPQSSLQHDVILDQEEILGMTPRRLSYAGKYILGGSLERPQLVERGEKVSITFREGPLVLSAKGKALESGAKGDRIRVTNTNSSRTIDAVITDKNQVVVQ